MTHLCTLLHALDQDAVIDVEDGEKITYSTSLYSRVMDVRLNFIISRFSTDNKEMGVEFLTEFYKQYFNSLLSRGKWEASVLAEAKKDLVELMEEYDVDNVNDLVVELGDIIADFMEVLIKSKDLPLPAVINN